MIYLCKTNICSAPATHLQDRRSDVATAPGAAPTAAFAAAGSAATIGALAAAQGADNTDLGAGTGTGTGTGPGTGLGGVGSGAGAESTMATAGSFNDAQSEEQRKVGPLRASY